MHLYSDLSFWWLIPWLAFCGLGVWFFYKNNAWFNGLSVWWRRLLFSIRTIVLFLVGVLLFGFLLQTKFYRSAHPVLVLLTDCSASMLNSSDSAQIPGKLSRIRSEMKNRLKEKFEWVEMSVGSDVVYGSPSKFTDANSAIAKGFTKINTDFYNRNLGAVVFISDGNFNKGTHPVYEAEKINFTPIYTLLVGDTVPKRDHYIKNVAVNDIAFLKNKFPVELDIEGIKMGKGVRTVSIVHEGKTIATQQVNYKDGKRDFEHVSFLVDANKVGFQLFSVVLNKESNEVNFTNNVRNFYVEILDSRSKIVILAGAPHPDVSALMASLGTDKNIEVESALTKDWDRKLKNVNLVIWHEPGINFRSEIQEILLKEEVPVLYCLGPNTNSATLASLRVGLQMNGSSQQDEVQGSWSEGFNLFEVSSKLKQSFAFFPPLKRRFGELKLSGRYDIAVHQRIGSVLKKDPLLYFGWDDRRKFGVLLGEGIWRWRINDYQRNQSFDDFNECCHKIVQYLVLKQNTSKLQVEFPKRFTKDEEVMVNATLYNEALQKINTPKVRMTIKDAKGRVFNRDFASLSDSYRLSLGKLNPGKYRWTVKTGFNGKSYMKTGEFVVDDIMIEKMTSSSNNQLMHQLASKTGGKSRMLSAYDQTIADLLTRQDLTSVSYEETAFHDIIDFKILFFFIILLLTLEWFFRKWLGSY